MRRPARRPRSLRSRLVITAVGLIALVSVVIGTVTTLALHTYLYGQLDEKVRQTVALADGFGPGGQRPAPGQHHEPSLGFLSGPTREDTVGALVASDGTVTAAERSVQARDAGDRTTSLSQDQQDALASVPRDGTAHSVTLPGLGDYRVVSSGDGRLVVGLKAEDVESTLNTLILTEVCVTAVGLLAAGVTGAVMVGVNLRPLRRVAATATRVSELPLHSGEVTLYERVPESEADPRTEVGQVGAALNRMLDHVHGALEARQQSETRVRQFVADASHELRTPLASIRGYAELTRRGREETGPDTRHALGRIESEAHRMTGLVEDLLLLARLDAGRPLSYEPTDLSPLVVDVLSDARVAGQGHRWRLELPDEPAPVLADSARLHQVLVNLLANARTHTPPGTTVTARVHRHGRWVRLDVQDDGPGIPPELLPHVFERFARGDSSRSRKAGSTGLGLAIVQAVAAAHGGAVTVESAPGRTVFTVHLPVYQEQPAAPVPAAPVSSAPVSSGPVSSGPVPAPPMPAAQTYGTPTPPHSQAGQSFTTQR
ncbi:sensor histidine kinase [Streptomyces beihaiensis]|uniref:histidine kinase n=1 Tax=Streptomyces beihaiensis TaxID=2984495 RepID=A0ABT3U3C7_9ACTN|nr:HAMP domain-containing sensor histidine kinase [Streptomyces beihaiensis]MCX3063196.1 HAMP domain-containing histidine kinase [Streptomyces beihaiensis]